MSDEARPFSARVARVNSRTAVVLNLGSENDVAVGDKFQIMSEDGIPVVDPETGEQLGALPVVKARLRVSKLYPRMCVATTYHQQTVGGPLSAMFGSERVVVETMDAEISQSPAADRTVRVGDTAELVESS